MHRPAHVLPRSLESHRAPAPRLHAAVTPKRLAARLSVAFAAVWLLAPAHAQTWNADFIIDEAYSTQNGPLGFSGFSQNDVVLWITKNGSIEVTTNWTSGIGAGGRRQTIINEGLISASFSQQDAILVAHGYLTIFNYGTLLAKGQSGAAMDVDAGNNYIVNFGRMETTHRYASAVVDISHGDNTVINHGTMLGGTGVRMSRGNNLVTNYGMIKTFVRWSDGISISDSRGNNRIVNYGDIIVNTTGIASSGMNITDNRTRNENNIVENYGYVLVTGRTGEGIWLRGSHGIVINDGVLIAMNGKSIYIHQDDDTFSDDPYHEVNLLKSSFLGGTVTLETPVTVNHITGPSHSVRWQFDGILEGGAPNVSGPHTGFYNPDTMDYATFEPTMLVGIVDQLGHTQSLLSDVGREGLARSGTAPIQIASTGNVSVPSSNGRIWAAAIGGTYEHDRTDAALDRDIELFGAAAGYGWQWGDTELSAMAGYLRGSQSADHKYGRSYRLDSETIFAGIYGHRNFGLFGIDAGLVGGHVSYESDRFINDNMAFMGESTADGSFDGWFVSPEVGVSTAVNLFGSIVVRPAVRVGYTYHQIGAYDEDGGDGKASVDDRSISLLTASASVSVEKELFGAVSVHATGGYTTRLNLGDDSVSMELVGARGDANIGDVDSNALYVSAGVSVGIGAHVKVGVEATTFRGDDYTGYHGHANLCVGF